MGHEALTHLLPEAQGDEAGGDVRRNKGPRRVTNWMKESVVTPKKDAEK